MLSKKYRLSSKDVEAVLQKGRKHCQGMFYFKFASNGLAYSRFAFIVSRKVAKNAVKRHQIKRRLSEITRVDLKYFPQGFDIAIISRPMIAQKKFIEIKMETEKAIGKLSQISKVKFNGNEG